MAELFEKGRTTITEHLKNIFSEGELLENSVCRDFRHTAEDGKSYVSKFYNLKAITAVGFRVNSHRAIEFRKWAGEILYEYIIKGFAMDDERLKQIKHFGQDYFDGGIYGTPFSFAVYKLALMGTCWGHMRDVLNLSTYFFHTAKV